MSHPYNSHRSDKVSKDRVSHIAKGRAMGGGIAPDGGVAAKGPLQRVKAGLAPMGEKAKFRADRVMRKAGGRVKAPAVNVIINTAPKDDKLALPPMPPAGMMPPPPPGPPPGLPPGAMAGPPPGGPPPGMPMRKRGGRVNPVDGPAVQATSGAGWKVGIDNGTPVQHDDALSVTKKNMNRKRVVTFSTGGGVKSFMAGVGPTEAKQGVAPATKMPGGAGGGKARLFEMRREKAKHGKTIKIPKGME